MGWGEPGGARPGCDGEGSGRREAGASAERSGRARQGRGTSPSFGGGGTGVEARGENPGRPEGEPGVCGRRGVNGDT